MDGLLRSQGLRGWLADFGLATIVALFLALLGPFGSYLNGPFWQRAAFQLACFWSGTLLYGTGVRLLVRYGLRGARLAVAVAVMVAALTVPFAVAAAALATILWPFLTRLSALDWYWEELVTAEVFILALTFAVERRARRARDSDNEQALRPPAAPALLGMPASEVLCLQMEDHYVRVHGRRGSQLVLSTMSLAVEALGKADGMQVHRSWWVARNAIVGAEVHGRNLRLLLVGELAAPVSRSLVAAVRAAGWLDGGRTAGAGVTDADQTAWL